MVIKDILDSESHCLGPGPSHVVLISLTASNKGNQMAELDSSNLDSGL